MAAHPYIRLFPWTVDPTVNNDETEGYELGDIWINTTAPVSIFQCKNPTDGAAVWQEWGGSSVADYADLGDVDLTGLTNGYAMVWDEDNTKWIPWGVIPQYFLDLLDTPSSFSGQGTKNVRVNAAADALEFFGPFNDAEGDPAYVSSTPTGGDGDSTYPARRNHAHYHDIETHIANATEADPVDGDYIAYRKTSAGSLRKVSWTNIKAFLKTYWDTVYAPIAKGVTNGDSHNHVGGDGAALNYTDVILSFLNGSQVPASSTYYSCPGKDTVNAIGNTTPWPEGGTLSGLTFRTSGGQPADGTMVITLQINTVDTALTVTVPAGSGATTITDAVNTVAINAGDLINWKFVNNATAGSGLCTAITMKLTKQTT